MKKRQLLRNMVKNEPYLIGMALMLICICAAGCITNPSGEQAIPRGTSEQRQFAIGDIVTNNLSDPCTGQLISGYHPPTDSYILVEVTRCNGAGSLSLVWQGSNFSRIKVTEVDKKYVLIGHETGQLNMTRPYRTIT
jgi:hypothetical protein